MTLPLTSISKIFWLIPVVAACSPPVDIAKQAGAGGSETGGSPVAPTGGFRTVPTGGSPAAPTGGSSMQATLATGGTTVIGGASGTGSSAVSSGGSMSTGGSAASSGGSTSTGGTATTGGSSSIGLRSRAIVVDPTSDRFSAYDAEGQPVHDYRPLLDFGAGFGDRVVCIDTLDYSWDAKPSDPFFATTVLAPPGQDPSLASTELIVTAKAVNATKPMVTVRVARITGLVTDEFSILGNWDGFLSSPSRQYLQGGLSGVTGIVLRRSNHSSVWQGPLYQAGFSPDDEHLIVVPASSGNALLTVELSTGRVTNFNLSSLPAGFKSPTDLYVRGTFNSGAVLTGSRPNGAGYALYWATWDGTIALLDPAMPAGVDEWSVMANRDATRLAFLRQAQSGVAAVDPSLLGWFEIDVGTTNTRALPRLNDTSEDCYDSAVTSYYTLSDGTLSSCSCTTAACAPFASWTPPSDSRWTPEIAVSPQRGLVGVQYLWMSQTVPASTTIARLYSATGALLVSVDSSSFTTSFAFDSLDQLALVGSYTPNYGKTIFSTATGHSSPIGSPARLAFGYE